MPRVSPFRGLRYDTEIAGSLRRLTAPPYDVISDAGRRDYLDANEFSVVHLDLAEGSIDAADPDSRYRRAGRLLESWEERGVVAEDAAPCYYAYEMLPPAGRGIPAIRGLILAMLLEPWGGAVLPHERTMEGPIRDRLQLLRATRTHLSAVYGTVTGPCPAMAQALDRVRGTEPTSEVTDRSGVRHRLWVVDDDREIARSLESESLLIADGHHRYTTALEYARERHSAEGAGPWDSVMAFVVDASTVALPVLPFHRIQLSGAAPGSGGRAAGLASMLGALSDDDVIVGSAHKGARGQVEHRLHRLEGPPPSVRRLHEEILGAQQVRFVPDADVADAAVRNDEAVVAWFLPPTTLERIRAVVVSGERLPEKSTYFWPKPRTGMVMMPVGRGAISPPGAPSA